MLNIFGRITQHVFRGAFVKSNAASSRGISSFLQDLAAATKEVEELTAKLRKQQEQSQQTAQELEQLRKVCAHKSLSGWSVCHRSCPVKRLSR